MTRWRLFIHDHYNLYFCDNCCAKIIRFLEDSVELPVEIDGCNTLQSTIHESSAKSRWMTVKLAKLRVTPNGSRFDRWKLSNDARRHIIKTLKSTA
jgi:hypothetical protein